VKRWLRAARDHGVGEHIAMVSFSPGQRPSLTAAGAKSNVQQLAEWCSVGAVNNAAVSPKLQRRILLCAHQPDVIDTRGNQACSGE
jgi:hypothetical protein